MLGLNLLIRISISASESVNSRVQSYRGDSWHSCPQGQPRTQRCHRLPAADIYHTVRGTDTGLDTTARASQRSTPSPLTFLISATMSGDQAAGYITAAVRSTRAISSAEVLDRMRYGLCGKRRQTSTSIYLLFRLLGKSG